MTASFVVYMVYKQYGLWWTPAFPLGVWNFGACLGLTLGAGQVGPWALSLHETQWTTFYMCVTNSCWCNEARPVWLYLGGHSWKLEPSFIWTSSFLLADFSLYPFPLINPNCAFKNTSIPQDWWTFLANLESGRGLENPLTQSVLRISVQCSLNCLLK